MTGFIEVDSGGYKSLINVAAIRYLSPHPQKVTQSIMRFDSEPRESLADARVLVVDHTYETIIQKMLNTDCVAVAR